MSWLGCCLGGLVSGCVCGLGRFVVRMILFIVLCVLVWGFVVGGF